MLVQIQCDKFAKEFQTIDFNSGLNTVLGSISGSSALGKSTFLRVIDFAFGGDGYCLPDGDIKQNVGDHEIKFVFKFDGCYHYFRRKTATPKTVARCDKDGHLIENMTLNAYRSFLASSYHSGVPFAEVTNRFFRIYGKENTYERYPYLEKPREDHEKATDFLLRLFGRGDIIAAISAAEDELGIKETQWQGITQKPKTFERIEENEDTIKSLKKRLAELIAQEGEPGIVLLGLEKESHDAVLKLQKNLRELNKKRNELKSQIERLKNGNASFIETPVEDDFTQLQEFFPNVNVRSLEEIEEFHSKLHEILQKEIDDELARLVPLLASCEKEIASVTEKLNSSGIAKNVTERVLSQGVSISKEIDKLTEENRELIREKEKQEERIKQQREFEKLIMERIAATDEVIHHINDRLRKLNDVVTGGNENAPILSISDDKKISFYTHGNTSEGTAFKSMVLYDIALLTLTNLPAVIHDGNILQSISKRHFSEILRIYQQIGKQIFIVVDKEEVTQIEDSVILELSEGHELFGFSWSKNE